MTALRKDPWRELLVAAAVRRIERHAPDAEPCWTTVAEAIGEAFVKASRSPVQRAMRWQTLRLAHAFRPPNDAPENDAEDCVR